MARTTSTSYASAETTLNLPVYAVPPSSLAFKSEQATKDGTSVIEKLILTPIDRPEMWQFSYRDIPNVYSDSTVPASARPSSSRGVQIMVKHNSFTTVTDTENADFLKILPFTSWTCIRVPVNEYITGEMAYDEFLRLCGGLVGETASAARITQLVSGALRTDS